MHKKQILYPHINLFQSLCSCVDFYLQKFMRFHSTAQWSCLLRGASLFSFSSHYWTKAIHAPCHAETNLDQPRGTCHVLVSPHLEYDYTKEGGHGERYWTAQENARNARQCKKMYISPPQFTGASCRFGCHGKLPAGNLSVGEWWACGPDAV
jgi:hypothetical protein